MLDKMKRLLGAEGTEERDELFSDLIEIASKRLKLLIGANDVPEQLEYIVVDVAIMRFNRIGSEGINHHTVEGELAIYAVDDFKPYAADIQAYKASVGADNGSYKVKFV